MPLSELNRLRRKNKMLYDEVERLMVAFTHIAADWRNDWSEFDGRTLRNQTAAIIAGEAWETQVSDKYVADIRAEKERGDGS